MYYLIKDFPNYAINKRGKIKNTKLTDDQVREIRKNNNLLHKELAKKYNCSQT